MELNNIPGAKELKEITLIAARRLGRAVNSTANLFNSKRYVQQIQKEHNESRSLRSNYGSEPYSFFDRESRAFFGKVAGRRTIHELQLSRSVEDIDLRDPTTSKPHQKPKGIDPVISPAKTDLSPNEISLIDEKAGHIKPVE